MLCHVHLNGGNGNFPLFNRVNIGPGTVVSKGTGGGDPVTLFTPGIGGQHRIIGPVTMSETRDFNTG